MSLDKNGFIISTLVSKTKPFLCSVEKGNKNIFLWRHLDNPCSHPCGATKASRTKGTAKRKLSFVGGKVEDFWWAFFDREMLLIKTALKATESSSRFVRYSLWCRKWVTFSSAFVRLHRFWNSKPKTSRCLKIVSDNSKRTKDLQSHIAQLRGWGIEEEEWSCVTKVASFFFERASSKWLLQFLARRQTFRIEPFQLFKSFSQFRFLILLASSLLSFSTAAQFVYYLVVCRRLTDLLFHFLPSFRQNSFSSLLFIFHQIGSSSFATFKIAFCAFAHDDLIHCSCNFSYFLTTSLIQAELWQKRFQTSSAASSYLVSSRLSHKYLREFFLWRYHVKRLPRGLHLATIALNGSISESISSGN